MTTHVIVLHFGNPLGLEVRRAFLESDKKKVRALAFFDPNKNSSLQPVKR